MKRTILLTVALTVAVLALASVATAAVPQMINYQGRLTDSAGALLTATVQMVFTIYDDSTGGSSRWTETQPSVTVTNGLFTVLLGSVNPIEDTVFNDTARWLGITVGGDPELTPRTHLVSVGYSHRVSTVDGATGGTISDNIDIKTDLAVLKVVGPENGGGIVRLGGADTANFGRVLSVVPLPDYSPGIIFSVKNAGEVAEVFTAEVDGQGGNGNGVITVREADNDTRVKLHSAGDSYLTGGNVGIGTATPDEKLTVDGNAHVTGNLTVDGTIAGGDHSFTPNGYSQLPGGLIIQWGQGSANADGEESIAFPISFPNACLQVVACAGAGVPGQKDVAAYNLSTTGFTMYAGQDESPARWIAMGY